MKYLLALGTLLIILSCGKEKVIQLPEISHSKITEINDVSPAYLFYDETKPDSIELNRKNLISTTNWLVNVDKRLTLKQVIPHIKYLQDKKLNSSHKNKAAKNYFTCNDTSKKNLGFIEFTDVVYHQKEGLNVDSDLNHNNLLVFSLDSITIVTHDNKIFNAEKESVIITLRDSLTLSNKKDIFYCSFEKKLTFQDYITFKSELSDLNLKDVLIADDEFIFN
ncbi:hypothetical protein Q4Q35_09215 [Flavivirga aquimarina]|uniref:Lipoprotein n=1 Tax=Flavivirga aquimarina TaxID=2027862 RepID=A0ABT8WA47_9FLAO|nr:hypothetical protein [Flavivirga aquimarina]MDO5969989.1 hypothetical protein [Flavivirga aquimarina]